MSYELDLAQLQFCRDFVNGALSADEFEPRFLAAYNQAARERPTTLEAFRLDTWLGVVWYEIDNYNEFDDLREDGEHDAEQLRQAVRHWLALWDSGEYDPNTTW